MNYNKDTLENNHRYEYRIESVKDSQGATDISELSRIINSYAQSNWRLKACFTNELGKDAISVAGFGINSTNDETILIFEREVETNDDNQSKLDIERKELPILKTNDELLFLPKRILIVVENEQVKIALQIMNNSGKSISAIKADIIFHTMFNEELNIENLYFYQFQNNGITCTSENILCTINPSLIKGIEYAEVIFQKYIMKDELYDSISPKLIEQKELAEEIKNNVGYDLSNILEEAERLQNVKEISDYIEGINGVPEELIKKLKELAYVERLYGNQKKSAIRAINEYKD